MSMTIGPIIDRFRSIQPWCLTTRAKTEPPAPRKYGPDFVGLINVEVRGILQLIPSDARS